MSTAIEPWQVATTTNKATSNTQDIYQNGKVGIGDFSAATPATSLDIETGGTATSPIATGFKLADGTQGGGKILTSDANGIGTWVAGSSSQVFAMYGTGTTAVGVSFPGSFTLIPYNTITFSSGFPAAPTFSNGQFTCSISGLYLITAGIAVCDASNTLINIANTELDFYVNGVRQYAFAGPTTARGAVVGSGVVRLNAGDVLTILIFGQPATAGTAMYLQMNPSWDRLAIIKM